MNLHDVFYFFMHYNRDIPDVFWLWVKSSNAYDKFSLIELIRKRHKRSSFLFKLSKTADEKEHFNCFCAKYTELLKPMPVECKNILKCLTYDPMFCQSDKILKSFNVKFENSKVTLTENIKTYKTHTKLGHLKTEKAPEIFDECGKLTVWGLYVCLNAENFVYEKLHNYLDIIDIYVLGILSKYRGYLPIRAKFASNEPIRLFNLSPYGNVNFFVSGENKRLKVLYRGVKCLMVCIDGVCRIHDDYGRVSYCGVKLLSELFAKDKSNFKLECIIQSRRNAQKANGKRLLDETFIITRLVSWENLNLRDASDNETEIITKKFLNLLREHDINQFKFAAIAVGDVVYSNYLKHCREVGNNGALFNGIYDNDKIFKFPSGHVILNPCGKVDLLFNQRHTSRFSAYFLLELNTKTNFGQLFVFNRNKFSPVGNEIAITLYKIRSSKYTVVKVYFNIHDNELRIVNMVYKPCVSILNVINFEALQYAARGGNYNKTKN
jgi:hypothetical protein